MLGVMPAASWGESRFAGEQVCSQQSSCQAAAASCLLLADARRLVLSTLRQLHWPAIWQPSVRRTCSSNCLPMAAVRSNSASRKKAGILGRTHSHVHTWHSVDILDSSVPFQGGTYKEPASPALIVFAGADASCIPLLVPYSVICMCAGHCHDSLQY